MSSTSSISLTCPVCKSLCNALVYQNHIQLMRCLSCRCIFNARHRQIAYNDDYFTVKYEEQYGKTYLEDFENIYSISIRRMKRILKFLKGKMEINHIHLVDIGSAMGFFLKAVYDCGIKDILGIEASGFAAGYTRDRLLINVINSSFEDLEFFEEFDIVTAWYFIEHCHDTYHVFEKIYKCLKKNGIFAFSMPSFFGPMFRFNKEEWQKTHPIDHRVDIAPQIIRRILKKMGFSNIKIYPGGIHPERILSEKSIIFRPFKLIYKWFTWIFNFSDTIEVYAVK